MTTSEIKYIKSLHQAKFRKEYAQFIAEGSKCVEEAFRSDFVIDTIYATDKWIEANSQLAKELDRLLETVDAKSMDRISAMKNAPGILAVIHAPEEKLDAQFDFNFAIYLDEINDPGNLGTILRIADWFGTDHVFASPSTVERFNPKVVQASMGSIFRMPFAMISFDELKESTDSAFIMAADMNGTNIGDVSLAKQNILVVGSESHGVNQQILENADEIISIPLGSQNEQRAESLNASVATGILCYEIRRKLNS